MQISASSFYGSYRPSPCTLRLYLRDKGVAESEPSPYEQVIIELGKKYELDHLATFKNVVDVSNGEEDSRLSATINAIKKGAEVIYQPLFRGLTNISGKDVTFIGAPDFLIKDDAGYRIRDVKLSRRITEKDHPEIIFQLGIYAWLFEQTVNAKPTRLEVLAGTRTIEEVPLTARDLAIAEASKIVAILSADSEPFAPVGWTKCGGCGFNSHCWGPAVDKKLVAIVSGVDKGLAAVLNEKGVKTIDDLLKAYDEKNLAEVQKPWGTRTQKVGKAAGKILRSARTLLSGKEEILQNPNIPQSENYVMFDLEGLPPQLDDLDKIYLWGIQVFGKNPGGYIGKIAGTGEEGDEAGWLGFLEAAKCIFDIYGDIPFVHWHHYERTKVSLYMDRFGDRDGIAERVKKNLLDLLPTTEAAIALPIPSYSLKVVEKYVGFKRTQTEFGGDWSMATFIKATETNDESTRKTLFDSILTYNREDLEATWAVFEWLRTKSVN